MQDLTRAAARAPGVPLVDVQLVELEARDRRRPAQDGFTWCSCRISPAPATCLVRTWSTSSCSSSGRAIAASPLHQTHQTGRYDAHTPARAAQSPRAADVACSGLGTPWGPPCSEAWGHGHLPRLCGGPSPPPVFACRPLYDALSLLGLTQPWCHF